MKKITILLFVIMFSFVCKAQTNTIIRKDSLKFSITPLSFYSIKLTDDYFVPLINYSIIPMTSAHLQYVCGNQYGSWLYDNYNHEFYTLNSKGHFNGAVANGILYYLMLLTGVRSDE